MQLQHYHCLFQGMSAAEQAQGACLCMSAIIVLIMTCMETVSCHMV